MAEALARERSRQASLSSQFVFASAGVAPSKIGAPADPRAIACVGKAGLDLSAHGTRAVDQDMLQNASLILALDLTVRDQLLGLGPEARPRIRLLMEYAPALGVAEVADPWSGTVADYDHAFGLIQAATDRLVASLGTG